MWSLVYTYHCEFCDGDHIVVELFHCHIAATDRKAYLAIANAGYPDFYITLTWAEIQDAHVTDLMVLTEASLN